MFRCLFIPKTEHVLFLVELKTALVLFANSIWRRPQVKTCCFSILLSVGFSAVEKARYPKCDLTSSLIVLDCPNYSSIRDNFLL